ncbi:MAG TPA: hypothetical protein ENG80_01650 [Nitrospirae bacterium]|nr:hypothetical protein BMS3Abin10_01209 [bacterium BMS3Abin10]HDH00499.1 hypothetical protein [Nitrospirota bacterium]
MFEKLIASLSRLLSKNKIPYMIIGGQAVLLHGVPRLTKDIDITLGISTDNISDVVNICRSAELSIIPDDYLDFVSKTFVLPAKDKVSGIRVDFIFSFTRYEQQAIKRGKEVKIENTSVNFASVEDVIIHKIFAGRPRDIEDVQNMILKNPDMDTGYIRNWLSIFDEAEEKPRFADSFSRVQDNTSK